MLDDEVLVYLGDLWLRITMRRDALDSDLVFGRNRIAHGAEELDALLSSQGCLWSWRWVAERRSVGLRGWLIVGVGGLDRGLCMRRALRRWWGSRFREGFSRGLGRRVGLGFGGLWWFDRRKLRCGSSNAIFEGG